MSKKSKKVKMGKETPKASKPSGTSSKDFLIKRLKKKFKKEKSFKKQPVERKESKRFRFIFRTAVCLLILGVVGVGSFSIYLAANQEQPGDSIILEDVPLPETGEEAVTNIEYYSPTFDLILHYPEDAFDISEGLDNIFISPKGVLDTFATLEIFEEESSEEVREYFISKYSDLYSDCEVAKDEEKDEGFLQELSYSSDFKFKTEVSEKVYHTIVIEKFEDSYVGLDIQEKGSTQNTSALLDNFEEILSSIGIDPVDLPSQIGVQLKDEGVSLSFRRKMWDVLFQDASSLKISFRSEDFEIEEELEHLQSTFSIYVQSSQSQQVDREYLLSHLEEKKEEVNDFYLDFDIEILTEPSVSALREIGGVKFYFIKYKYTLFDKAVIKTEYFGFDSVNDLLVEIVTEEENTESEGSKEIESIFSSIEFKEEESEAFVFTPNPNVLGTGSEQIQKAAVIGKPSVVHIFNKSCVDIEISMDRDLPLSSGRNYSLCSLGFGSGFFINKDGYIVTNAHVAAPNPVDLVINAMLYGEDRDNLYNSLRYDAILLLDDYYPEMNISSNLDDPETIEFVETMMASLIVIGEEQEIITLGESTYENYVQGEKPFSIDKYSYSLEEEDEHDKAEMIGNREIDSVFAIGAHEASEEEDGIRIPDLAVIKISPSGDISEYPTLRLSDHEKLSVGAFVNVIGFPGSAYNEDIFSREASLVPTVTSGTISAIKPNFDNTFDLIQIDASLSYGNSGGPILNSSGELVGVATYMLALEESADFNAGVSVEEVADLLVEENIENNIGNITPLIEKGIEYFSLDYYQWAVEKLEEAKSLNAATAEVLDPIIANAEEKINQGEDNTPILVIGDLHLHKKEIIILGVFITAILFGGTLLILLLIVKLLFGKRKKKVVSQPPQPQRSAKMAKPSVQKHTEEKVAKAKPVVSEKQKTYKQGQDQQAAPPLTPPQPQKVTPPQQTDVSSRLMSPQPLDPKTDYVEKLSGEEKVKVKPQVGKEPQEKPGGRKAAIQKEDVSTKQIVPGESGVGFAERMLVSKKAGGAKLKDSDKGKEVASPEDTVSPKVGVSQPRVTIPQPKVEVPQPKKVPKLVTRVPQSKEGQPSTSVPTTTPAVTEGNLPKQKNSGSKQDGVTLPVSSPVEEEKKANDKSETAIRKGPDGQVLP